MTVRSKIRSILGKSEAENLRDFERTMATLGALVPQLRCWVFGRPVGRLVSRADSSDDEAADPAG